jgi:hypothetical protein
MGAELALCRWGSANVQFSLHYEEDFWIAVHQLLIFDSIGTKTAVLRDISRGTFLKSSQVGGGTEIVYGALITALVLGTSFDGFFLREIGHHIVALQNYPVAIQIYLVNALLHPHARTLRERAPQISTYAVRRNVNNRSATGMRR